MSSADKKQIPKKSTNSYSLLLKGLNEVEKSKSQNSKATKKSSDNKMSEKKKNADKPSSSNSADMQEGDGFDDPDIPDRSYGDYYCKICDSHMNSDNMWDAHVTGKRHIKNVKKGDTDSKYEDLPNEECQINLELEDVKEPVVGLSYIHEIRRKEKNVPPIYNCFLCHASIATCQLVIEHVKSLKHRFNYVKENDPEQCQLIEATNLKKGHMEPLVIAAVTDLEQKFGRGSIKVKQEKKKDPVITYSAKKTFNVEDAVRFDTSNPSWLDSSTFWKPVEGGKNYNQRDRSRSPRDFVDNPPRYSRSRSPKEYRSRNHYSEEEHSVESYRFGRSTSPRRNEYERSTSPRRNEYERRTSPRRNDREKSPSVSPKRDEYGRKSSKKLPRRDDYDKERSRRDNRYQMDDKSSRKDDFEENMVFRNRDKSPPRDDYHFRNSDAYIRSLRKSSPVEHTTSRDLVKKPLNNFPMPQTSTYELNRGIIATSSCAKSVEDGINYILPLGNEGCYKLIYGLVQKLPEITQISEMCLITKIICEMQKKLNSDWALYLIAQITEAVPRPESSYVPGTSIREAGPSNELCNRNTAFKPSTNTWDVNSLIKSIFQSANMSPTSRPSSQDAYLQNFTGQTQPTINSQQASHNSYQAAPSTTVNTYQAALSRNVNAYQAASSTNINAYQAASSSNANAYQAASSSNANAYQAPSTNTNSYQVQSSYQVLTRNYQTQPDSSYTSVPFASGSAANNSSNNIPGIDASKQTSPGSQVCNFQRYLSSPSSKNYPHKY